MCTSTPRNIMIVGSAGSGKSTLAQKLGEILGQRVVHIDHFYWEPNWVMRDDAAIKKLVVDAIEDDGWVFEGNCSSTYTERAAKADTIIWLDIPRYVCVYRAIIRALKNYGKGRPDMALGCYDRLDWRFFKWVWNYPKNGRPKHLRLFEETQGKLKQHRLRNRKEIDGFLKEVA